MKTTLSYVGFFVGLFIGAIFETSITVLLFSIIGCLAGRALGNSIDEEQESQKRIKEENERRKRQEEYDKGRAISLAKKYPEATKYFFKQHWGETKIYINDWDITYEKAKKLLTHTEYEYRSKEESLNSAYRAKVEQEREQERKRLEAQREAERKAAERKRLEEERARQREVEEKRNLVNSLPACVESWQSHSNSNLKHRYFYEYFSYDRYKNYATPSMWDTWHTVWDFKNDIGKNVSMSANAVARNKVVQLVESTIRSTFGTKTKYLTLVCLTASTQNKTERRFREFSERVCRDLNMTNAYPHIRVVEDGSARHDGGDGNRTVQYDRCFFNDKYVILFDDVRTSGRSLEMERRHLESMGAKVICAITIAQTKNM